MTNESLYQQLLENPRFVTWATNQSSSETNDYWDMWIQEHPEQKETLVQARLTIKAIYGKDVDIPNEEISKKIELALTEARRRERSLKETIRIPVIQWKKWLAAASVLLLLGLGWIFTQQSHTTTAFQSPSKSFVENAESENLKEVVYTGNAIKHVRLSDGSSVVLFKNSKLTYPENFSGSKRVVALSGDAFFEVTKDPSKPFYVYAGGIVTKVLGTSFSIKTGQSNSNITVLVKTGKVSVYREKGFKDDQNASKQTSLVLSPNEQAVFEMNSSHLSRTSKQQAGLLEIPIENLHFNYNHTPVSQVFGSLEKAYGVAIRFDKETFANCSLTAELGDEPLDTKLEWICSILEATYKIKDQEIIITGKPCE